MEKTFLIAGIVLAVLGVMLGAFGAHGLKSQLSADMLSNYQTGVEYHFYHALGLILLGLYVHVTGSSGLTTTAGILFIAGIVIFSGSLYLMAITDARWLGAVTPVGGLAFISGWLTWAVAVYLK